MAHGQADSGAVAAVLWREDGAWRAERLPARLGQDLDALLDALRQQPADDGSLGLVNVGDEFFVVLRVRGEEVRMLVSDVTAAVAWDLARQVVGRLEIAGPRDESDVEEVWPAGDLSIFADLGMDEMELGAVLAELDTYADEMLARIGERVGFADAYARALAGGR